jgi:hypothetical protein
MEKVATRSSRFVLRNKVVASGQSGHVEENQSTKLPLNLFSNTCVVEFLWRQIAIAG